MSEPQMPADEVVECERSAGDGGTCADEPDADLMGWCDTCSGRRDVIGTLIEAAIDALPPPWRRELARSDVETVVHTIAPLIRSGALGRPTSAQLSWHVDHFAALQRRHDAVCATASEQDTRIGELEAQVSTLASLVAFAYLVDVEFSPEWMDATRAILGAVGWEVDPQDWRNWDWSDKGAAT